MKVLQLISTSGYYGAEAMMVTLAEALRIEGIDNGVGLLQTASAGCLDVAAAARRERVPVEIIPCHGRWDQSAMRKLREIIYDGHYDVIHAHGYKADMYAYAATSKSAVKRVATCHNSALANPFRISMVDAYGWVDTMVLRRFEQVAAVSQPIAHALVQSGVAAERVRVVENGIALHKFTVSRPATDLTDFKAGAPLVALVARLAGGKGHEVLLRAAKQMTANGSSARFVFVGDGPLQARLQQLVAELGLAERVRFAGRRADMPAVYAAVDVIVLPSENEGMPISILEAMAARKPVIASNVGGIPDVIADRRTGLLVPPSDVARLREAIAEVIGSPAMAENMAATALAYVQERYSAATMAARYSQIYEEALGLATTRAASVVNSARANRGNLA